MRSDLAAAFSDRSEELLRTQLFQNFRAQSHSRDVLRYLGTPPEEWPSYSGALDENLVFTAQYLLYLGLRLKGAPETEATGDANLTLGAEILEHVYARAGDDDPERDTQLFTAALAYYMSGHFARAFVLVRDLEAGRALPRFVTPIRHLLLKEFSRLRGDVIHRLVQDQYSDERIAAELDGATVAGTQIGEDEAFCRVFEATLFRAISYFLEYAKTGVGPLLLSAEELLDTGIELAIELRFADWWWYLSCVRVMLTAYRRHSLWSNLKPLLAEAATEPLARRYIQANLRLPTPLVELWPSQVTAVPYLFGDAARKNLCLRMPTSAGKTKVAELAILGFLARHRDDPDAKCVYVAPFRSLAVEVEQSLKRVFLPLGVRVSELYGGFELTVADRILIEKTQILVATPEKLDAFSRVSPEYVASVKLVILDEGHIISPTDYGSLRQSRGLKYEVFLQRLVSRFRPTDTRILFLSAVMPNADQFAEWIAGDSGGLVTSDWRPSRLMLGEAVWDGQGVSLEYTHANQKPLEHRCFVRTFVTQRTGSEVPRPRRKPFPADAGEALALTALEFAARGLTMVFVARKASAEPLGRTIRDAILLRRRIAEKTGSSYALHVDPAHRAATDRCAALARDHMGADCEVASFLEEGFVVHHGSLPQAVRLGLERLVRSGAIRLVVATTTLAQGVNFPIHTVLVHSLDHGQDDPVSPMDFWNVCGRAGRGMHENEGQVLFFVPLAFDEWGASRKKWLKKIPSGRHRAIWKEHCDKAKRKRAEYIANYGNYRVQSALRDLVFKVVGLWREKHGTVNVAELCEALANHTLDLFASSDELDLESLLSSLDGLLLAMTEGREDEEVTADTFQELLHCSLLHLQLKDDAERSAVNHIFAARIRYIRGRHADAAKRRQFYRLGLPLADCEKIDGARDTLLALYLKASKFSEWSPQERTDHLADVAEFLFTLTEIAPLKEVPDCWRRILHLWLCGQTPTEIASDPEVVVAEQTAHAVSRWLDDTCGYRLPWGYNVLALYLKDAVGDDWPAVCDSYSALAKYGVHEPVACWLLTFGVPSRRVATETAALIDDDIDDPDALLKWLQRGGLETLEARGLAGDGLEMLRRVVQEMSQTVRDGVRANKPRSLSLRVKPETASSVSPDDRVVLQRVSDDPEDGFTAHTLRGELIGKYDLPSAGEQLWSLLEKPDLLDAVVKATDVAPASATISLQLIPI